ncbi:Asp23/Gls24 family envelope stress response protein [Fusibacter sp. JL216-2]|uniref:Asp23/Gls24 family envelope stress response protein n=1 Tax=Fusibacter sp. JL216-2 TaxID=3071453 RepID=UPI003D32771C
MAEKTQLDALEYGNVNISDDVIGIITSIAAAEIEGVNGLSGGFAEDIAEMFGVKNLKKGVKVDIEDDIVVVDLNIIVDFGIKIPDVAWQVQENVKNAIETMTGLACKEVNIHVQGINMKSADDTPVEELIEE